MNGSGPDDRSEGPDGTQRLLEIGIGVIEGRDEPGETLGVLRRFELSTNVRGHAGYVGKERLGITPFLP